MAKTFKSLLSLFLAVMMVASLMVIPSSAASISLSKSSVTLTKGYQTTLSVSGTSSTVTWSTGDKSVATVTSKGKVVGKGVGTTYIYAKVSNTTLKCKVKVVAAKITASSSNVTFDKAGDTKTVTMTVKGSHSGLTVGSTDKSVATASWVRPIEWDGDKIKIKITAKGEGTAKIKVYLKNYPSTCYKYITVNVGSEPEEEEETADTTTIAILPYTQNVNVAAGSTYTLQVYCSDQSKLACKISNSSVASFTEGTASGYYRNYTIKGLAAGTATLRLYNKYNTSRYTDVTINVSAAEYYTLYTAKPSAALSTDSILTIKVNSTNYYMIVPQNYDPAYANTVVAKKFGKYSYYEVYDAVPTKNASSDTIKSDFTNLNTSYVNPNYTVSYSYYSANYGTVRYMLLPSDYDQVKVDTAIAKYNNKWDYFTIYNEQPTVSNWSYETFKTWTVTDSSGSTITRYMLVNKNVSDYETKANDIMNSDKNTNSTYSYYTVYTTRPTVGVNDTRIAWTSNGSYKYMVVPIAETTGYNVVKINDLILKDTGIYEYNVMYSTEPTADSTKNEAVDITVIGGKRYYVLYVNDSNAQANLNKAYDSAMADGIK